MTIPIEKTVHINAPAPVVWEYLTNPDLIKKWIGEPEMKIEISTDWKVGSPIIITGFHHINFEDKGSIVQFEPGSILQYTHLSSLSRLEDKKKNYSIITFNLAPEDGQTKLTIRIENFPTEAIFKHLEFYWKTTAEIIKRTIENK